MADLPINYGDSWKVARDKINDSFNELAATVEWYKPQIINWVWWIWTTNTGVKAEWDSIVMKVEDWYIWYKSESNSWTKIIAVADLKWSQGNPWADWNWIASVTSTKVWKTTTVTMNFDEWEPFSFEVQDWADWVWWDWDVKWPDSSTNWHMAVFDWATWKVIRDWGSVPTWFAPWNDWTTGQVLKKTNSWYEWDDESGWGGSWDVVWPDSSTNGHLAVFDGTTGKLIKDGGSVPTWVPSWGTDGQVLSKVSWNIAWANPSGWWDVVVSSQTGNILTTGMKIRCGTEWDYANLGTYDSNSLYLTVPWGATPWWWQPWADTIVYYPFDTDWNDYSWNGYNFTTTNSTQITTVGWVTCLDMNGSTCSVSSIDVLTTYTDYTWLTWIYVSSGSIDWAFGDNGQGWWWSWFRVWQFKQVRWGNPVNTYSTFSSFSSNQWVLFWIVMDNWEWSIYQNWVKTVLLWSGWLAPYNNITPFSFSGKDGVWAYGYISNFIIEKRAWTYQEIQDYFDQTKSTYWIS